jgi:hypothetical protein
MNLLKRLCARMNNTPYDDLLLLERIIERHELAWVLLCLTTLCEAKSVKAAEKLQDTTTGKRYAAVAEALKAAVPLAMFGHVKKC